MFRSDAMIGRVVGTRLAATSPDGRRRCANEGLCNDSQTYRKARQFKLQKRIAISFRKAIGLRNDLNVRFLTFGVVTPSARAVGFDSTTPTEVSR